MHFSSKYLQYSGVLVGRACRTWAGVFARRASVHAISSCGVDIPSRLMAGVSGGRSTDVASSLAVLARQISYLGKASGRGGAALHSWRQSTMQIRLTDLRRRAPSRAPGSPGRVVLSYLYFAVVNPKFCPALFPTFGWSPARQSTVRRRRSPLVPLLSIQYERSAVRFCSWTPATSPRSRAARCLHQSVVPVSPVQAAIGVWGPKTESHKHSTRATPPATNAPTSQSRGCHVDPSWSARPPIARATVTQGAWWYCLPF